MDQNFDKDFQDVLQDPVTGEELGADELAVHAAGLTHPNDVELENIMAEHADTAEPAEGTDAALNAEPTQVIPVFEDGSTEEPAAAEAEAPDEEETEEEEIYVTATVKKGRPKMKKGYGLLGIPHIISTAIWLAITVMIGVSLGRILWVCCADVMAFGKPAVTAYITVTEDDDIESVSQKLADANLVRYPGLFQKFAEITKKHDRINVGTYELGSHLDYNAMINNMVYISLAREEVEITFPEGFNCHQYFRILEENGVCTVEELEDWVMNGELKEYWFLEGLERTDKYWLEGYLSPDTYRFYTNDDPQHVLEKFLDAFDAHFTDIMKDDFADMQERYAAMLSKGGFDSEYIAANPLTLHKLLTLASVVEREAGTDAESFDMASIFYNRLTNPDILNMGSDATVYYALGDYEREIPQLTEEHLNVDSPYNTKKYPGFPPGPICNPGVYALYAALDPNDINYHYFLYDLENNMHHFSATYSEHQKKIEELGL